MKTFLEKKLKLMVNPKKSKVDQAKSGKFLGFSCYKHNGEIRIRIANRSKERLVEKLRCLTKPTRSGKLETILTEINRYLAGWVGYYRLAKTPSVFEELDKWIRRRLRQLLWKRERTRYRELAALGVPRERAALGAVGKSPWHMAKIPVIQEALNNANWRSTGLESLLGRYRNLHVS